MIRIIGSNYVQRFKGNMLLWLYFYPHESFTNMHTTQHAVLFAFQYIFYWFEFCCHFSQGTVNNKDKLSMYERVTFLATKQYHDWGLNRMKRSWFEDRIFIKKKKHWKCNTQTESRRDAPRNLMRMWFSKLLVASYELQVTLKLRVTSYFGLKCDLRVTSWTLKLYELFKKMRVKLWNCELLNIFVS